MRSGTEWFGKFDRGAVHRSLEESQMLEFKAALFEPRAMNSATVKFSEPFSPTSHTK
jgi:hypothetical protein